jgi:hypothetical protein
MVKRSLQALQPLSHGFLHFRFLATAGLWTKFQKKGPALWRSVTLRDNLAYYSCMLQMTADKLFTRCVFHCEMTVCTVFFQSHQRDFILR